MSKRNSATIQRVRPSIRKSDAPPLVEPVSAPVVDLHAIAAAKELEFVACRAMSMVDNAPINIMFAGPDLKISYVNPASLKTLKGIEHLLPVKADQILGQSVDIFHKKPEYQRGILSDPKNLPRRTNIQIAAETLDLMVSPIFDKDKNYLGAMVTWDVITQKLATEKAVKDAADREKLLAAELAQKVEAMLAVVTAAGKGDLTQEVPVKGADSIGQMGEGLAAFLRQLRKTIGNMGQSATALATSSEELTAVSTQMSANAEETSAQANVVSAASEQVSKNVQTVATAAEEMTASIKEKSPRTLPRPPGLLPAQSRSPRKPTPRSPSWVTAAPRLAR